jgi:hypothetical protein
MRAPISHLFLCILALGLALTTSCGDDESSSADTSSATLDFSDTSAGGETTGADGPCIEVLPLKLDFDFVVPPNERILHLEITNCSRTHALEISAIDFAGHEGAEDRCAGPFCVVVPAEAVSGPMSLDSPLVLQVTARVVIEISYAPESAAPFGEDGQPVRDRARLHISSNARATPMVVQTSGYGVADTCPVAVAWLEEGEEVIPQTQLHLHGDRSFAHGSEITTYTWSVEQPELSTASLVPSGNYPSPVFDADVAGKYVFHLEVVDEDGVKSCFKDAVTVFVVPDQAIHIELLWASPGDPVPTDQGPLVGTDLDLHFAHPNAEEYDLDEDGVLDPWFDEDWDTFWYYPTQEWGDPNTYDDNPSLDLDDVDTSGPENLNFNAPEDGLTYAIGVNYWDDHGFGTSFAAVRVFVWSELVYEVKDVHLYDHDMWWVADLEWPSGSVEAKLVNGIGHWITHDYHHPVFYEP